MSFSKNTPIILIGIFIALFAVLFTVSYIGQKNAEENSGMENIGNETTDSINTDTDGDGLKDWEEPLWRTNPENADSDSDGTNDGDEIAAGRNPTVAGPDDLLSKTEAPNDATISGQTAQDTEITDTDVVSRELFASIVALKQGEQYDNEAISSITKSIAQNYTELQDTKTYYLTDIKSTDDNTPASLREYGNNVGKAMRSFSLRTNASEMNIIASAIEDKKELEKLPTIINAYNRLVSDLAGIKTPSDVSAIHLAWINHYNKIGIALGNIKYLHDDPTRALYGITQYNSELGRDFRIFNDVRILFMERGVVFEEYEAGYAFSR